MKYTVSNRIENVDGKVWEQSAEVEALTIDEIMMDHEPQDFFDEPPEHFNEHNVTMLQFTIRRL